MKDNPGVTADQIRDWEISVSVKDESIVISYIKEEALGMYPHQNLDRSQRAALDRLRAPRFRFRRYWAYVTVTDPDGKGVLFYPRTRRTWAFCVKGYPVIQVAGKLCTERSADGNRGRLRVVRAAAVRAFRHPRADDR
jgi:hypothetical protein